MVEQLLLLPRVKLLSMDEMAVAGGCPYTWSRSSYSTCPKGRGALIVFEGIDHSGKSLHCLEFVSYVQGFGSEAMVLGFPIRVLRSGSI